MRGSRIDSKHCHAPVGDRHQIRPSSTEVREIHVPASDFKPMDFNPDRAISIIDLETETGANPEAKAARGRLEQ
jgi:hypothetical protein